MIKKNKILIWLKDKKWFGHYYLFSGGHGGTAPTIRQFSAPFCDFCETFLSRARQARPYNDEFHEYLSKLQITQIKF